MPIYQWKCRECKYGFELLQAINESDPLCPKCNGKVDKQIGRTSFKLKGDGWADQGYAKKDK